MSYHNFEDVEHVASFIADLDFTIRSHSQRDFSPNHVKYYCSFTQGGTTFDTTYQCNPAFRGEPSVTDVFAALVNDAADVAGRDIDDFADELGFTKPSEAIRAYESCQKSLEWLKSDLGLDNDDISQLAQMLDGNMDEVKEEVGAITVERAVERERTHPKVPEGFVSIESLQADLDLGDYGDQLADYSGDITDAIQDCADSNVDIYYHDLLKWLPDNYEWIEEAEVQGLLEGIKGDIFKMIQMAQYECFSQDMYDHQEDIVKYVTLESLKDAGVYAVSRELADALDTDVDYAGAGTFDEALDEAKEQVHSVMAANLIDALGVEELAENAVDEIVADDNYGVVNPAALSVEAIHVVNEKGYDAAFAECDFWKEYMEQSEEPAVGSPSLLEAAKECRDSAAGLAQDGQGHEQGHDTVDIEH